MYASTPPSRRSAAARRPARYPDLHAALFAAYACVHLGCAYLAALYAQWRLAATEPPHTPFDDARADVPLLSGAKEE